MPDTVPIFALNIMFLGFDTYYLVRQGDYDASTDVQEFVQSDPAWVQDPAKGGYVRPRTALYEQPAP